MTGNNAVNAGQRRQPLGGDFRSREREITTMMKWPQGRPGLNGENLASGQKPINIRRRDVSEHERASTAVPMTDLQRDRRNQFKVEKVGPNMPPRPQATRPLRSKKPSQLATGGGAQISGSGYNSAQKARESSQNRWRESSTTRNASYGPVLDRTGNKSRESLDGQKQPMNRVPSAKQYQGRTNNSNTTRAMLPRTQQQTSNKVRAHPSLMNTSSSKNL